MRTTTIERLECRRLTPYDPNDHSLLDRNGTVAAVVEHLEDGSLRLRMDFKTEFRRQGSGEIWGLIEGQATTAVVSGVVHADAFSKEEGTAVSPTLVKLIEGALAEDVFLPVSAVARAMHLPSLLIAPFGPQDFRQEGSHSHNARPPSSTGRTSRPRSAQKRGVVASRRRRAQRTSG